jgi:NAD(P)-dependent dehydrogenase (short-subunit alcohol dehydrogenase family)
VTGSQPVEPRSVFITGGNRGIGLATARAFAALGHRVAVGSRTGDAPDPGLFAVTCDVGDTASVDAAFTAVEEHQGNVEVLISNAGQTRDTLLVRMSDEDFTDVVNTNLVGAFRVSRRAIRSMMRARYGRMVFVSSVVALTGSGGQTNYSASKAGLIGLARSIAREYATRGVTANVVAPGLTDTDMTAVLTDERKEEILRDVPMNRLAQPEEIAGMITWLASDAASYISGAVVPITGAGGTGF